MAINQNHPFEELNGIKCSVVERNVGPDRVKFLKELLEVNKYEVVVVSSPPPKVVAKPAAQVVAEGAEPVAPAPVVPEPVLPETFSVGVTDLSFNAVNAIFGRLLRTADGHVVTRNYWLQRENISHDDIPYYES